jgi:hypothetical protein
MTVIASTAGQGFETGIAVAPQSYVAMRALDPTGYPLGSTAAIKPGP